VEHARSSHLDAFILGPRLLEHDILLAVYRHLPAVAGMSFLNVYAQKLDAITVGFVDLVQADRLKAKWWSRVRAEDKRHRFVSKIGRAHV
jgi:hypothetical protein